MKRRIQAVAEAHPLLLIIPQVIVMLELSWIKVDDPIEQKRLSTIKLGMNRTYGAVQDYITLNFSPGLKACYQEEEKTDEELAGSNACRRRECALSGLRNAPGVLALFGDARPGRTSYLATA